MLNIKALFPTSVSAFIVDANAQLLLVSPDGVGEWQVVSGMLEQETIAQGITREIAEELGDIEIRILDVVDAHTYMYEGKTPLISVFLLVQHLGGCIRPSDDIHGFVWRWFSESDCQNLDISCPNQYELIQKAFFLAKLYSNQPNLPFLKHRWKFIS